LLDVWHVCSFTNMGFLLVEIGMKSYVTQQMRKETMTPIEKQIITALIRIAGFAKSMLEKVLKGEKV